MEKLRLLPTAAEEIKTGLEKLRLLFGALPGAVEEMKKELSELFAEEVKEIDAAQGLSDGAKKLAITAINEHKKTIVSAKFKQKLKALEEEKELAKLKRHPREFQAVVEASSLVRWDIHECSMCKYECGYVDRCPLRFRMLLH